MKEPVEKAQAWFEEYQRAETPEEKEVILRKFQTYLGVYPWDSNSRYIYALLLLSENRIDEALHQVEECLLQNPIVECIILKAKILNSAGRSKEAYEFIEQVKHYLKGKERMELEISELLSLINCGEYEKALSLLKELGEEKLMEYMAENPGREQNIVDILNELESYEKGKRWADENKKILNGAIESVKKHFKIISVIPKIEGDWEISDRPVIYINVLASFNTNEEIEGFLEKEKKALEEFYEKFPSTNVRLFIEPVGVALNVPSS